MLFLLDLGSITGARMLELCVVGEFPRNNAILCSKLHASSVSNSSAQYFQTKMLLLNYGAIFRKTTHSTSLTVRMITSHKSIRHSSQSNSKFRIATQQTNQIRDNIHHGSHTNPSPVLLIPLTDNANEEGDDQQNASTVE